MRLLRPLAAALAAALLAVGCGPSTPNAPATPTAPSGASSPAGRPSVIPLMVSQEVGVGPNRLVFGFVDPETNEQLADPERTMEVGFIGPQGETIQPAEATFIWAIENERAVYAINTEFPSAGAWTAHFRTTAPGAPDEQIQFGFDVRTDTSVVRPGEPAPSVDTPTADDVGGDLSKLSTDTEPVPAFYETSLADALAAGDPFVVAFATPKFCTTAQCGPTLERLKPIAKAHPDVTFINVEPYQLEVVDGQLQPVVDDRGQLQAVPAVTAFGLRTEPYLFVVDAEGVVRASFELIFGEDELQAALDDLG